MTTINPPPQTATFSLPHSTAQTIQVATTASSPQIMAPENVSNADNTIVQQQSRVTLTMPDGVVHTCVLMPNGQLVVTGAEESWNHWETAETQEIEQNVSTAEQYLSSILANMNVLTDTVQKICEDLHQTTKKVDEIYDVIIKKNSDRALQKNQTAIQVAFTPIDTIADAILLEEKLESDEYQEALVCKRCFHQFRLVMFCRYYVSHEHGITTDDGSFPRPQRAHFADDFARCSHLRGNNVPLDIVDKFFTRNFFAIVSWTGVKKKNCKEKTSFSQFVRIRKLFFNLCHSVDENYSMNECDKWLNNVAIGTSGARLKAKGCRISRIKNRKTTSSKMPKRKKETKKSDTAGADDIDDTNDEMETESLTDLLPKVNASSSSTIVSTPPAIASTSSASIVSTRPAIILTPTAKKVFTISATENVVVSSVNELPSRVFDADSSHEDFEGFDKEKANEEPQLMVRENYLCSI